MEHTGEIVRQLRRIAPLALTLLILGAIYAPTVLAQPAGGTTAYMDDVGEMQVALNVWGTVHHTGYPLFTMLGNLTVSALRAVGVSPALAPSLYSLLWGIVAVSLFYALALRFTGRTGIAAALALLFGLVRSIWIHHVIPEVYGLSLAFVLALLAIALWPMPAQGDSGGDAVRRRVLLLALIGGFGVAHHRLVAFIAPGLLVAIWPELWRALRTTPRRTLLTLVAALPVGLIGFLPYIYLPVRAQAGAEWVYGNPQDWPGFWHEFTGAEAAFLMRPPPGLPALASDALDTLRIIGEELTPFLALAGLVGIAATFRRRESRALLAGSVGYVVFLLVFHRAVMPEAVIMPVSAMLLLGVALGIAQLPRKNGLKRALVPIICIIALFLFLTNFGFVRGLTNDPIGLEAIQTAQHIPRDGGRAVLMLPWSSRYTAVAFSKYVTGENAGLGMAKHTADFAALRDAGHTLYTFRDVFYRFPLAWWDAQIGRVSLSSPAPGVVAILSAPTVAPETAPLTGGELAHGVAAREVSACRAETEIRVTMWWQAMRPPDADLSVFVHLLSAESPVPLAQADSAAPVYGWYPMTRWQAGEVVTDQYAVGLADGAARVKIGFYEQPEPGKFVNYDAAELPLEGLPRCP